MRITICFLIACFFILLITEPCFSQKKIAASFVVNDKRILKTSGVSDDVSFLESLLKSYPQYFDSVLLHKKDWNVQIIYTQINRDANNKPNLKNYYFNVDDKNYFYPASTVKFPVALLALQKLHELTNKRIDKNSTIITSADTPLQTAVYNDPTSADGIPSIAQYIKKILLVSDNDAFNRLYEFLGQDYINTQLHKMGYADVQILHRLQILLPKNENKLTNAITFLDSENHVLYYQPLQHAAQQFTKRNDFLGKAYYTGDSLINAPMNFSEKNRFGLNDLHKILISFVFPKKVAALQRFNLTDDDRQFMLQYMSQYPTETFYPPYNSDTTKYWQMANKYLLFGGQKGEAPKQIRIFNKIGGAYGQLVDVAYIVDYDKKIEFFLSAIIYCNSDGILNDDKYDYNTIGLPFMKNLGQVIYDYEAKRQVKNLPDLSKFIFKYDK